MTTPIFVVSLPRSGSTLLQRLLTTSSEVATTSEPWILLPLLFQFRDNGLFATYRHQWFEVAVAEAFGVSESGLPDSIRSAIVNYANEVYGSVASGRRYFVDKTPRYSLILPELLTLFDSAKFICLTRNPADIIGSMISTWGARDRWNIYNCEVDLYCGLANIAEAIRSSDSTRVLHLRFEDLVADTPATISRLERFLEFKLPSDATTRMDDVKLGATMGDQTGASMLRGRGVVKHQDPASGAVTWNGLRNLWLKRYVEQIGARALGDFGYSREEVLARALVTRRSVARLPSDAFRMTYGYLARTFQLPLLIRLLRGRERRFLVD